MEQKQKQKPIKIIYSKKICEELMLLGFRPIEMMPNPIKPNFVCWVFEDTDEFEIVLNRVLGGAP